MFTLSNDKKITSRTMNIHIKLQNTFMILCYLHCYLKLQYRIRKQKLGDIMNVAANSAVHYNKESRRLN